MNVGLRHLRYFVAVAEEGHFGRAAARLGIQQPPLSRQIRNLEKALGFPLFHRRPHVALTNEGRALLEEAGAVIESFEDALERARRTHRGEAGVLRLGFPGSMMLTALSDAIREFRHRSPGVRVEIREISTGDQLEELRQGRIDVGFLRESHGDLGGLVLEPVISEELVAVLPSGHPLASEAQLPLGSIREKPVVLFPPEVAPGLHHLILSSCLGAGFVPRVVQEAQDWVTIVGLVAAGIGISLVPASFERLAWEGVRYRPISPDAPITTTNLAFREDASAAVRSFRMVAREVSGGAERG